MTINYTTLLGLAQPVTGTEAGTWGDTVNDAITALVEQAVAGGTSIDVTGGNVTLTSTAGTSNQARNAILLITGTPGVSRNVIAPSSSKVYIVRNGSDGEIVLKGSATTGVTIPVGVEALCFWNGSDFEIAGMTGPSSATDNAIARFDGTTGKVVQNSVVTIADSTGDISGVGQLNATTLDATNLEVTNIKAKDGTANISIADTTGIATFSKATVIETTDNTNAALRITQLGTGNAFVVEDSANPDATPFAINANGQVIVGGSVSYTYGGITSQVQAVGTSGSTSSFGFSRWSADTAAGYLAIAKSRGAAIGTNSLVSSGDNLGFITFNGDDGSSFLTAAQISTQVDGTPGTNDMPGRLVFSTTADGASSPTERMRITNAGNALIGGTAVRGTTVGSAHLDIFNGTAPAGTLTNGISLYSSSGDFNFMDSSGNGYKVGYRNVPAVGTKTGSYTLATGDVGKYVQVGSGGSITIPDATFAEGDVVSIFNNTTAGITITCTITTAYIAGTDSDKASVTLATRGVATILFISSTVCVITGNVS